MKTKDQLVIYAHLTDALIAVRDARFCVTPGAAEVPFDVNDGELKQAVAKLLSKAADALEGALATLKTAQ